MCVECEKQVNNLRARLEQLERENVEVKKLVSEAEKKSLQREKSTQCDASDQDGSQREGMSANSTNSAEAPNSPVFPRTSSQFISVADLLSQQMSDVGTQQGFDNSTSMPQQCQHARDTTTVTSQQMTSTLGSLTSQAKVIAQLEKLVSQPQMTSQLTSQTQAMTSQSDMVRLQPGALMSQPTFSQVSQPRAMVSQSMSHSGVMTSQPAVTSSQIVETQSGNMTSSPRVVTSRQRLVTNLNSRNMVERQHVGRPCQIPYDPTGSQQSLTSRGRLSSYPSNQSRLSSLVVSPSLNTIGINCDDLSRHDTFLGSCMLEQRHDSNENRQTTQTVSDFLPCQGSGRPDLRISSSLCLPGAGADCQTQIVETSREAQTRETSSYSVQSLTGQNGEQRTLSLPVQQVVETPHSVHCHPPQQQNYSNATHGHSHGQWQRAQSVSYSPLKYVTPHRQFEGSFSIDAIQGNRNMPSRPQRPSQTFTIERLTSSQIVGEHASSQSRFDIQSMIMSRDRHVTQRESPTQWEGLNYAVSTRLLRNNQQHGTQTQTSHNNFLTHFNTANSDSNFLPAFQQNEWASPVLNCQWQQGTTQSVHDLATSQPNWSESQVSSQTSQAHNLSWQFV